MIRTPYIALERSQRKLAGSKLVFDQDALKYRLQLATGEILTAEQAAKKAGINYVPYIWHETRPGGAIYHE